MIEQADLIKLILIGSLSVALICLIIGISQQMGMTQEFTTYFIFLVRFAQML